MKVSDFLCFDLKRLVTVDFLKNYFLEMTGNFIDTQK